MLYILIQNKTIKRLVRVTYYLFLNVTHIDCAIAQSTASKDIPLYS